MSSIQIPNLPAAIALTGAEEIEIVQAGVSTRTTTAAIAGLSVVAVVARFQTDPLTISVANTLPALTYQPQYQSGVSNGFFMLVVNGSVIVPQQEPTPFTVASNIITWTSLVISVWPGDIVAAIYNY